MGKASLGRGRRFPITEASFAPASAQAIADLDQSFFLVRCRMQHRMWLAVAASDMIQLEFIIRALERTIDEALSAHGD